MSAVFVDPSCSLCSGSGLVMGGDEYQQCPSCRLTARRIYADRIRAAADDSAEAAWKDLRDAGADELTLRAMAGDR